MRVLFISHEDSKFGAPKSLMELMHTLKINYSVEPIVLLHSRDDVYEFCKKENIQAYVVGHRNIICGRNSELKSHLKKIPKNLINRYDDYRVLKRVYKILDMSTIDIIHSNVTITSLGMSLRKKYHIPHIVHLRETASNVENYVHTRNYLNMLSNGADYFIAISDFNKNEWTVRGLDSNKIWTIYNGLNLSNIEQKQPGQKEKIKIVFSGALSSDKGQDTVIESLHLLPLDILEKVFVDFMGTGSAGYTSYLQKKTTEYELEEHVRFCGYVDKAVDKYHNYDVGLVASKAEAFGRVTVEYMAVGLCVIASNSGANPELIEDKINGVLFDYGNPADLASKIRFLVENPNIREEYSHIGKECAYSRFTTETNARNIVDYYNKFLELR